MPRALARLGLSAVSGPPPRPRLIACADRRPVARATAPTIAPRVQAARDAETLAVLVPGFLDSASWAGTRSLAGDLHRSGRTAVSFDPRGTFSTPGAVDQVRPSIQIRDAISAIGMVRPHARTVFIGHSLGASIAVFAAAEDPRVTDVVAIMPPRCFVWPHDFDPARNTWRRVRRLVVATPGSTVQWQFKVPPAVVVDAVGHDLPARLRTMPAHQRILFIAGRDDTVIPVSAVERLFGECSSRDKSIAVLPVGHDYRDHPDQLRQVNDAVLTWLAAGDVQRAQPVAPPDQRGRSAAVGWPRAPAPRRRTPAAPGPRRSRASWCPNHVALVMDGNGRWANARGLPRIEGHRMGEASLMDVARGLHRHRRPVALGVRVLHRELAAQPRRGALPHGLQPRRDPPPGRRDARAWACGCAGRGAGRGCGAA